MKFSFVTIHVKDLDTSIQFYEDVIGLKVTKRFPAGPNREIAFLGNEQSPAEVELIAETGESTAVTEGAISETGRAGGAGHVSIGFAVDDLDEALNMVKTKGIAITIGPVEPTPGTRFFFMEDPDGVPVEIIQHG